MNIHRACTLHGPHVYSAWSYTGYTQEYTRAIPTQPVTTVAGRCLSVRSVAAALARRRRPLAALYNQTSLTLERAHRGRARLDRG